MGSSASTRKFHEEHNDTYCGPPSTFLLDESAFNSTLMASQEVKVNLEILGCSSFLRELLNQPHIGQNDHNQYVKRQLGSDLSSKLAKLIKF